MSLTETPHVETLNCMVKRTGRWEKRSSYANKWRETSVKQEERATRKEERGRCKKHDLGTKHKGACAACSRSRRETGKRCTRRCTTFVCVCPRLAVANVAMRDTRTRELTLTSPYLSTGSLILISGTCVAFLDEGNRSVCKVCISGRKIFPRDGNKRASWQNFKPVLHYTVRNVTTSFLYM